MLDHFLTSLCVPKLHSGPFCQEEPDDMLLSLMPGPCLITVMMGEAYMEPPLTPSSSHQTPRPPHAQALREKPCHHAPSSPGLCLPARVPWGALSPGLCAFCCHQCDRRRHTQRFRAQPSTNHVTDLSSPNIAFQSGLPSTPQAPLLVTQRGFPLDVKGLSYSSLPSPNSGPGPWSVPSNCGRVLCVC